MKPIELTEEHKTKLLEMCEVLFPEYKININLDHFDEEDGNLGVKPNNENGIYKHGWMIHWFEFCHCYLLPKLITERNSKLQFYMDTFTGNPIEYLYEEFKKLKE
jgi:hypothetical protein